MQTLFSDLYERAATRKVPTSRPTFHSMLHAPSDQFLFGDDVVLSTEAFEKGHRQVAKIPFQDGTNRTLDQDSLSKQMISVWFQQGFVIEVAVGPKPGTSRLLASGLVSRATKAETLSDVLNSFHQSDEDLSVDASRLLPSVTALLCEAGTWNTFSNPSAVSKEEPPVFFVEQRSVRSGSGFRLSSGVIIRPFSGKALSDSCILQIDASSFVVCFGLCELDDPILCNTPLFFCKKLDLALKRSRISVPSRGSSFTS